MELFIWFGIASLLSEIFAAKETSNLLFYFFLFLFQNLLQLFKESFWLNFIRCCDLIFCYFLKEILFTI